VPPRGAKLASNLGAGNPISIDPSESVRRFYNEMYAFDITQALSADRAHVGVPSAFRLYDVALKKRSVA
jgi:hypothetical protein